MGAGMMLDQPRTFRRSMAWLHGWAGLLSGWVLFAVFVTGALSFFRDEITWWMMPELHGASVPPGDGGVAMADRYLRDHAADARQWTIAPPGPRRAVLSVGWRGIGPAGPTGQPTVQRRQMLMDAANGAILAPRQTAGGGFLYHFHYRLYGLPDGVGPWIVFVAALAMALCLVTGVVIHRTLIKDIFTFRPRKDKRSWMDGHNVAGVLALPFHAVITFSGLLLLAADLLPYDTGRAYGGDGRGFARDMHADRPMVRSGPDSDRPAPLADLGRMAARARDLSQGAAIDVIAVLNPGRANALVEIIMEQGDFPGRHGQAVLRFDGVTGEPVAAAASDRGPALAVWGFAVSTHLGRFADPATRVLLFGSGVLGAAMVASGLAMWLVGRQRRQRASAGRRLVQVLNVAVIAGLLVAVAAYFWANRLVPAGLTGRADWEIRVFFLVWLAAVGHAAWRRHGQAWTEQLLAAGALTVALPLLNPLTGGAGLWASLARGQNQVAGFDLMALLVGGALLAVGWTVRRHAARPGSA